MINPATLPSDQLNSFTHLIVEYDVLGWAGRWVRLRNGALVRPVYTEAEDEYCENAFLPKTTNIAGTWTGHQLLVPIMI